MSTPSWNQSGLGTMKRVALWLVQEVGAGEIFTKTRLREAFPGTSQVDRRMRDLRDFGWQIDTSREDPTLGAHEQRFVAQGDPVWEPGKATRKVGLAVTASERHELMMRDGHMCRSCGIGPGERYAGTYVASQLDIARRKVVSPDGSKSVHLVVECNRCRVGHRDSTADLAEVLARVDKLPAFEKKILTSWIEQDKRNFSEVEELWATYRTLPAESRNQVQAALQ
ncbi:hypothetical protein ACWDO0_29050 [Nocardia rhamnosiphila]|uniref:hypothetical protein n=1 Tax=Nocardia rhamnosiphila TaxID=426716 RepID=UPI0033EBA05F